MNILVTGGTGFIGSHTVVELLANGHDVTVIDNLSNSGQDIVDNIQKIAKRDIKFVVGDLRDSSFLDKVFSETDFDLVVHIAALKAVGESIEKPLAYYDNNVTGLIRLLESMEAHEVRKIIFSSSATVYGDPSSLPIYEDADLKAPTNPYGATKQMCERIISDVCNTGKLQAVILRYFNPIGAHDSGLLGERPAGTPNNLIPFVTQTAAGKHKKLIVYGNDFDTKDGTAVRDYIHVVDLAKAHVKACELTKDNSTLKTEVFNIGTGVGYSVMEIVTAFEKVNNLKLPVEIGPRRAGDIAACYASADKANKLLHWKAELSLEKALLDAWNWEKLLDQQS